jgi:hypothetical protein
MVMACSTHRKDEKYTQILIGNSEGKGLCGRPRHNGTQKPLNHKMSLTSLSCISFLHSTPCFKIDLNIVFQFMTFSHLASSVEVSTNQNVI